MEINEGNATVSHMCGRERGWVGENTWELLGSKLFSIFVSLEDGPREHHLVSIWEYVRASRFVCIWKVDLILTFGESVIISD